MTGGGHRQAWGEGENSEEAGVRKEEKRAEQWEERKGSKKRGRKDRPGLRGTRL